MIKINYPLLLAIALFLTACSQKKSPDGAEVLQQASLQHDPQQVWAEARLTLHIQEPRLLNPHRYSVLTLDNAQHTFELSRNRDQYISKHIIDNQGNMTTLLDGSDQIDSALIDKYRLDPARNTGYRDFYHLMYGLPMSLDEQIIEKIESTTLVSFNGEDCFRIALQLKKEMFSKHWYVFIARSDYMIRGLEIFFPNEPEKGERLYFDQLFETNSLRIPRVRHWHELKDDSYSGTDIIIKEINE